MQVKKFVNLCTDIDIDIVGITLLSSEEYKKLKNNIKPINVRWWLRSPGYYTNFVTFVNPGGGLSNYYADNPYGYVRPVLIYKSENLSIGDGIYFSNYNWTVISNKYILCDESLCRMAFRKDYTSVNAGVYEASDIKKYLDDWFKKNVEA